MAHASRPAVPSCLLALPVVIVIFALTAAVRCTAEATDDQLLAGSVHHQPSVDLVPGDDHSSRSDERQGDDDDEFGADEPMPPSAERRAASAGLRLIGLGKRPDNALKYIGLGRKRGNAIKYIGIGRRSDSSDDDISAADWDAAAEKFRHRVRRNAGVRYIGLGRRSEPRYDAGQLGLLDDELYADQEGDRSWMSRSSADGAGSTSGNGPWHHSKRSAGTELRRVQLRRWSSGSTKNQNINPGLLTMGIGK